MTTGTVLGAVVGFFIGWIVMAFRTRATIYGSAQPRASFSGPGGGTIFLVETIFAVIGAIVGSLFWP